MVWLVKRDKIKFGDYYFYIRKYFKTDLVQSLTRGGSRIDSKMLNSNLRYRGVGLIRTVLIRTIGLIRTVFREKSLIYQF